MNPFDLPPTSAPVSTDPPNVELVTPAATSRRGRMALVALATAGMIGGGVVAVSQFAAADEPALLADTPTTTPDDDPVGPVDDPAREVDGEIVIDLGNGDDPMVVDLGELGQSFSELAACLDLPLFDGPLSADAPAVDGPGQDLEQMIDDMLENLDLENLDLGSLDLGSFGDVGTMTLDGTHVTVLGPDGVSVIELGDGDGSVTITRTDGELTIATDGDATVQDLPDFSGMPPFGEFGPGGFDLGEFDMGRIFGDSFDPSQIDLSQIDLSQIESCLAELG
jgi:hypothetical protein